MSSSHDVLTRAKAWLEKDPDPLTKKQLADLIQANDMPKLNQAFADRLEFGTAGLRGIMGVGYSNMNLLVVLETTAGLAQHLLEIDPEKAKSKGVAIAFDGRFGSREFAYASAQHFAHRQIPSHIFPIPTPTPLCGYAVKRLGLAGGIVVTASHNPKEYNGYKVYGPAGTQINTPTDSQIANQILKVAQQTNAPTLMALDHAKAADLVHEIQEDMFEAYMNDMRELAIFSPKSGRPAKAPISITYSPLHGVGAHTISKLAREIVGFKEGQDFWIVEEQSKPDGAFPTLEFPNPEELSTLELNHKLSDKHKTDLAIVNDPDADRLAVSARDRKGELRALTGDQLGTLLGDQVLRRANEKNGGTRKAGVWTLSTIVSSRLLARLSGYWGGRHVETLTGFKWLGNVAMGIEQREGVGSFGFGYEEALGYMSARSVWDKDGLSSFLLILSLAFDLAAQGKTLWDRLEEIHALVGVSVTSQRIIKLTPGRKGTEVMTKLRADLTSGKKSVEKDGKTYTFSLVDDLSSRPKYDVEKAAKGDLSIPKNDVLRFYVPASHVDPATAATRAQEEIMLGDTRIIVRPSGTEPKVKIYSEAMGQIRDGEAYDAALSRSKQELDEVVAAFWDWMSA